MIDIVIPVQQDSQNLEITVKSIEANTKDYELHIIKDSTINVSEARQRAMDTLKNRYLLFMDDDSIILDPNWLANMLATMNEHPDAGIVFAGEWWGTEPKTEIIPIKNDIKVEYGPAACMLIDKSKLTSYVRWDQYIGLRNHWLGGDFEEVDFCYRVRHIGLKCYQCTKALFHHAGDKTTLRAFQSTDRSKTARIMQILLDKKYMKAPEDENYFQGLQYVHASPTDMNMLGPTSSLRECYFRVINRNGLSQNRQFRHWGLI